VGAHPSGKKTEYGGVIYDSPDEARFAQDLDARRLAGEVFGWTYHPPPMPLVVNGHLIARWHPDFVYIKTGTVEPIYVEVKGRWKAESKLKMKLFRALYPYHRLEIAGTPMDGRTKEARAQKSARIAARLAVRAERAAKRSAIAATRRAAAPRKPRRTEHGSTE